MVFVNGLKYACATCVKGHRSSACHHSDRPLFEIKKKGRPITQCQHCRELRKTKQVHVKCMCTEKIKKDHNHVGHHGLNLSHPDLPNGISDLLTQQRIHIPSPPEECLSLQCCESTNMSRDSSQGSLNTSCECGPSPPHLEQHPIIKQEPGVLLTPPLDNADRCGCSKKISNYGSDSDESPQERLNLIAPRPMYPTNMPYFYPPESQLTPPNTDPAVAYIPWTSYPSVMEDSKVELVELKDSQQTNPFCENSSETQYDDIDNDTPIFDPNELNDNQPREQTLLGALSETSSEDLMNNLYMPFTQNPNPNPPVSQTGIHKTHSTCGPCSSSFADLPSCCSNNQNNISSVGESRRLVTCRCGDNCACAGCLVHPREVMRNAHGDPYAGFEGIDRSASNSPMDLGIQHSVRIDEDGVLLCGCGCEKPNEQCRNCIEDLCEEYLLRHPQ